MWEQGLLPEDAYYWQEGMNDWRPISEYFHAPQTLDAPPAPPSAPAPCYTYKKNPRTLTSFLVVMLWISLGAEVASLASDFSQMALLSRESFTQEQADANDARQGMIGLGYMAVFAVTGITFLRWVYRANSNCHGFGAQDMRFTPGWAVGYYFIPFVNLVRPYQVMKEICQVCKDPRNWSSVSAGALVNAWWTLQILSGFLGQLSFRISMEVKTIVGLQIATTISIASGFVGIVLCFVTIAMIKNIFRKQEALVKSSEQNVFQAGLL